MAFSDRHLVHIHPALVLQQLGLVSLLHHQDVAAVLLPGSTFALDVTPEGLREVELDDQITRRDVNSLLHDTGGHQHIDLSCPEPLESLVHPFLLRVDVDSLLRFLDVSVRVTGEDMTNCQN